MGSLFILAGVAGILMLATTATVWLPRVGVVDSVFTAGLGLTVAIFFSEGVPAQVWRNLFARDVDYAGRFFPLAGSLVCLVILGVWGWGLDQRLQGHDYTPILDVACFMLGMIAALICGRRRQIPAPSAAIA